MKKSLGFTLIELMITVAIAAILIGVAVPSMTVFIQRNRIATTVNELVSASAYARSEAVMRGIPVMVCNVLDGAASAPVCATDTSWARGWIVFVDANGNNTKDASETVLRVFSAVQGNISMTPAAANESGLIFNRSGQVKGLASSGTASDGASFTVCSSKISEGRSTSISTTGRVSTTKKDPC